MVDGRVLRDVDGQRGFAHRGAGGDDDQLALLQAAGHAVEFGEVSGQAGDLAALLVEIVDGAEGILDDLVERLETVAEAPLGSLHQSRFNFADHVDDRVGLIGRLGNGQRADGHEPARQALFLDDANILFDDRTARQSFRQAGQVGHAADGVPLLVAVQFGGQRHNVHGPLGVHQLGHAQEDAAVRVEGKIVGFELFGGLGMGGVVQ